MLVAQSPLGLPRSRTAALVGLGALATAVGAAGAVSPSLTSLAFLAALGVAVIAAIAARIGWPLATLLPLLAGALLTPQPLALVAQAGTMLLAAGLCLSAILRRDSRAPIALAFLALLGYWTLQIFNSNVPDIETGLLGLRKTAVVFAGLVVGVFWPYGSTPKIETWLIRLLVAMGILALGVHFLLPGLEQSFSRGADEYTALFNGEERMQGFFPGPFHVALLGAFVTVWGAYAYAARTVAPMESAVYLVAGLAILLQASVRTGFVTVAIGIVLLPLLRSGRRASRLRTTGLTALLVLLACVLLATEVFQNDAISSISQLSGDQRALGRLDTWAESITAIQASPVIGWGAGAAGSTLGPAFGGGVHVTSHNAALAWGVEGGLVGLMLVAVLLMSLLARSSELLSAAHPASAAVIAFVVFGLTGEVGEALPVSLFLAIVVGLRARTPQKEPQ